MNERERLIELLNKSCEAGGLLMNDARTTADYLLENGVVVLSCKVGDTLFFINRIYEGIIEAKLIAAEIDYKNYSKICITIEYETPYTEKLTLKANLDELLNVRLFLTREEAEQAIEALKGGSENE